MKTKKFISVFALESAGIDPRSLGLHRVTGVDALGRDHTMWVQIDPADKGLEVELARTRLLIGHQPFVAIATEGLWINIHEQHPGKLLGTASILPCGAGWAVYLDRKTTTVYSAFDTREDRVEKAVKVAETLTRMCNRLRDSRESRIAHPIRAARMRAEISAHAAARADRRAEGRRKAKEIADTRLLTKAMAWYAAQRDYFRGELDHNTYVKRDKDPAVQELCRMLRTTCPHFRWTHNQWFRYHYEARGRFVYELTWGGHGAYPFVSNPTDRVAMATPHGAEALADLLNRGAEKCGTAK